jgi:hypothetical protein
MGETQYLNTDLDLESGDDLSPLTDELHLQKWAVLHSSRHDDGVYRAGLEHMWNSEGGPERVIRAMLEQISKLPSPLQALWASATQRDFNIGIEAGSTPHATQWTLGPELIELIASAGASVTVTVYASSADTPI